MFKGALIFFIGLIVGYILGLADVLDVQKVADSQDS